MRANVALTGLGLAAMAFLPVAAAEAQGLDERLAQMERRVGALERGASQGPATTAAATGNVRDAEMAAAIRDLIGRLEEVDFQLRRLNERVDKLSAAVNEIPAAGTATGRQR